jgi:hypothetical protein
VCSTKNFASVRLYSAPQLHLTIVAILGICAYYCTPKTSGKPFSRCLSFMPNWRVFSWVNRYQDCCPRYVRLLGPTAIQDGRAKRKSAIDEQGQKSACTRSVRSSGARRGSSPQDHEGPDPDCRRSRPTVPMTRVNPVAKSSSPCPRLVRLLPLSCLIGS